MHKNTKIILVVLVVIVLFFGVWWFCMRKKTENFSNIGAVDNVGSLDSQYEVLPSAEDSVPTANYADMVDTGDHIEILSPNETANDINPLERLDRVRTRDLLPRTAASVTPYNVDVADATSYSFAVNVPRVQLKNRLYSMADPFRGDIPIKYNPNVALIAKSSYSRDSQRLDGFFSDAFSQLYNRSTGRSYHNLPLMVSTGGTHMDSSM
jgi:hypothetical protein